MSSIELILRSLQKDNEYTENLNSKGLKLIDVVSQIVSLNISSQNFDSVSRLIFLFLNYILRKDKNTPGEEYTNIKKQIGNSKNILLYVIMSSLQNFIFKKIHNKLTIFIENKTNYESNFKKESKWGKIILRIVNRLLMDYLTFENFLEKFDELQYCLLFVDGRYNEFIQWLFGFSYTSTRAESSNSIIDKNGFKFFGYFILIKLSFQFIQLISKIKNIYKEECSNYNKEEKNTNTNEKTNLNIKIRNNTQMQKASLESNKNCLLCLEDRKETSATLCGHLFCWNCITKYLQTNTSCPFCRQECHPQNVIFLQNLS